ncbi:MAG: hypothetical protein VB092_01660 [Oscillospiraceae bacterium]|nr:hypothetical protein [Oscillospiraceae bacterium]
MDTAILVILVLSALCVPVWVVLRVRDAAQRRADLQRQTPEKERRDKEE